MNNQIGKKRQLHKTTDSVLHDAEQTLLPRRSLLSKYQTDSGYIRKCNFIHASDRSTPFPEPIFTKLKNTHQHDVQTWHTELHQNGQPIRKVRLNFAYN